MTQEEFDDVRVGYILTNGAEKILVTGKIYVLGNINLYGELVRNGEDFLL